MSSSLNLSSLRILYKTEKEIFRESSIKIKEPFNVFKEWMETALKTEEIIEPNAASLATVSKDGKPSNRFVLLKDYTENGFTFFTNYDSRKANDIEHNPNVAMTIYWCPLRRSIRIEGKAEKILYENSLKYFHERPRSSQIGALASPQSQLISDRDYLDKKENDIKLKLKSDDLVPMPNWGGYLIRPELIEFWQGQTNRLHDRIRFRKSDEETDEVLVHKGENGWVYERLAP